MMTPKHYHKPPPQRQCALFYNRRLHWCDRQAWCRGWCRLIWASADLKPSSGVGGVRNAKLGNEAQLLEFFKAYPGLRKIIGTRLIVYGHEVYQPEPPSLDDKTLSDHSDYVTSVSWHPTQPLFASGSNDVSCSSCGFH